MIKGLTFWMGEIRSIADDTGSGKCQVRIFGEEDDMQRQRDENLRWSEVAFPTTTGQVPGSSTMHGLMQGTKVVGFYYSEPGKQNEQKPIILCVLSKPSDGKTNTP
jgi:hypothetical protein